MTASPLSVSPTADPAPAVVDEYFDALLRADQAHAVELAVDLLEAGVSGEDVLLRLVVPTQVRVGVLWQTGAWSVAQEHAATCVAERVVLAVGDRTRRRRSRGHVVLGCLDGEWHTLAPRIVGEVLQMHGWKVTFLGASTPVAHLVSFLHDHGPEAVALSAAAAVHLPVAHRAIVAAQRTGTPVLVGGPGFGPDGRWARRLGADAWAPSAPAAAALLAQRASWPDPTTGGAPDLPDAVSGTEYAGVRQRRGHLVVAAMEQLRSAVGAVVLSDSPVDDDIGQLADVLAAAAYLGDGLLFTDHVGWLAAVAAHRGSPAAAVPLILDAVGRELHEFPFAQACLVDAHGLLDAAR